VGQGDIDQALLRQVRLDPAQAGRAARAPPAPGGRPHRLARRRRVPFLGAAGCGSTRGGRGPAAGRSAEGALRCCGWAGPGAAPSQIRDTVQSWLQRRRCAISRALTTSPSGWACAAPPAPERGADPLGQRLGRRLDPPELAADPFQPGGDRLWWPTNWPTCAR
jgi:hypothetical protein